MFFFHLVGIEVPYRVPNKYAQPLGLAGQNPERARARKKTLDGIGCS